MSAGTGIALTVSVRTIFTEHEPPMERATTIIDAAFIASRSDTATRNDADDTVINPGAGIRVSVVVPTCGRADLLNRCLEALTLQDVSPTAYEIIVVDDGPSRSTEDIVAEWTTRMSEKRLDIFYIPNHGQHGPAAARNRGWHAARAPIIAFTDDDTVPAASWLKNGLAKFNDKVDAIWGRIEMPVTGTPTDYERDAQHLETAEFVTANCFCRKKILEQVGGFDERYRFAWREDSDFYFSLLNLQASIVHAPQAVVVHPVRPAPWGVSISQQKKILFDALLYKKHPRLYREKIRATPRWDYYLTVAALVTAPLALAFGAAGVAAVAGGTWLLMTGRLCWSRLRGTTKTRSHVGEMLLTSALIPPLAVFWRMVGAFKFRAALL
jgi:GT2 family glycosyltransferase